VAISGLGVLIYSSIRSQSDNPILASQDDVPRVTVDEAYEAVSRGEAILVDTRSLENYQLSHAAGALSLPVGEVEARLGELDPTKWVITYCT
ncbi:MAG: hypothetical protein MUO40_12005, partial [Anaerolineaceae bacterium]|nr:hypothetical protein [Anaerolineaceae bacterium]